ncbi:4Fe-4S ferredoxin [Candidatus Bathyarchaeota archaeon]|nr:4Fe-4S ferredoxin [Candidatus Bathyarchaeota archaeon]MDP6047902.1 hydrogenase iron-sulfur subunit [Candidatus Bathyarchaeota archaeon]MDP7207143.1 hydrogenase iron-sulfur subunit [Candidatus Bathyarchaeota archaeon]MDP7442914.1 hydrogenase iron-sulfur subunit [Candidatus Bathyarchaeota archaeon]
MSENNTNEPRIGVFLCHCGSNIAGVVGMKEVAEHVKGLPSVDYVEENLFTCSSDGIQCIQDAIAEEKLERVVVASCTPRTHQPLFRNACEEAGLNQYLFQMVNIREHDSWVHKDQAAATEKAKYLVQMGVAKAQFLEPEKEPEIDILPVSLVIGGGVSGLSAALSVAKQGFDVYLVEKETELGGIVKDLHKIYPTGDDAKKILETIIEAVKNHERITVFTSSEVSSISGFVGSFSAQITSRTGKVKRVDVGTIIVATGAEVFEPQGYYSYGINEKILTQLELEKFLGSGSPSLPERVVMIQCVGAMEENGRTYCSRICCGVAIKNALHIKELSPDTDVYILYRDLLAYGIELEEYYREALRAGIKFVNFVPEQPPNVSILPAGGFGVNIYDTLVGLETTLNADMIILSTPLIQREGAIDLAMMLRVPIGTDQFFLEAHPKMRPVDFSSEGIYLCGTAHGPKGIMESIAQAYAAASRAAIPMAKGKVYGEAVKAVFDPAFCVGCAACAEACPFEAITMSSFSEPNVNEAECKGCGICAVECPMGTMQLKYFKDSQLIPAVEALLSPGKWMNPDKSAEPAIVCFACKWCSYAAADFAGVMRLQYPDNLRIILVPCTGRVDFSHIYKAFEKGADGVIVAGCLKEQCHYIDGNLKAERRIDVAKKALDVLEIGGDRLEMLFNSAGMPREFAEFISDFTEKLRGMNPSISTKETTLELETFSKD